MIKDLIKIVVAIIVTIPIIYIALCFNLNLDYFSSFYMMEELYQLMVVKKVVVKAEIYISLVYGLFPLLFVAFSIYKERKKKIYGNASFATSEDIKKMGLNYKRGTSLGKFKGKTIYYDNGLSTLVIASPGTGKTSSVVIPNLLSIPTSQIVLDIKGELEKITSNVRKNILHNEILIFNPLGEDNTLFFNPFDEQIIKDLENSTNDKEIIFAKKFALTKEISTIIYSNNTATDEHWKGKARLLFQFFAIYDILKKGYTTLYEIMRFPKKAEEQILATVNLERFKIKQEMGENPNLLKEFCQQVMNDNELPETVQELGREIFNIDVKEFSGISSTFSNGLDSFNDIRISRVVSKMNFKYEDLRKKNITIYLKVKEKDIAVLSPILRIIIDSISKNLTTEENKNPNERVHFWLDEFTLFGKMEHLMNLPSISRSYNLPTIYLTQTEAQIEKTYKDNGNTIKVLKGNTQYKIIFTLNDLDTAKSFSEEIGNTTETKKSKSQGFMNLFANTSTSQEKRALVPVQDLMNIPINQTIVSVAGFKENPIKTTTNYYFKSSKFKKMLKKYPPKED